MSHEKPWFLARPIAHRGLHHGIKTPENSLASFEAACVAGYPIELDCHFHETSGELIVFHDVDLLRLAQDPRTIQAITISQLLKTKLYETEHLIPNLDQVLEVVNGRVPLLIETKQLHSDGHFEQALVAKMDDYQKRTGGEWAIQSFHHGALYYIQRHFPHVAKAMLSGSMESAEIPVWQRVSVRSLALLPLVRPQFISFEAAELIRIKKGLPWQRALGTPVVGWTIRSKKELKSVSELCDNIIFENFAPETK